MYKIALEVDNTTIAALERIIGRGEYIAAVDVTSKKSKQGAVYPIGKRTGRSNTVVENIVQATARDCLAEAMFKVERAGYKIVMHVHDEVILDTPKDKGSLKEVNEIFGEPIDWAPGLPLKADGYECKYYMKD